MSILNQFFIFFNLQITQLKFLEITKIINVNQVCTVINLFSVFKIATIGGDNFTLPSNFTSFSKFLTMAHVTGNIELTSFIANTPVTSGFVYTSSVGTWV